MKHRQATPLLLLTLYGLLIAALLVLTLAGARCYAAAADSRQRHADARNALAFLQTQAASCGERSTPSRICPLRRGTRWPCARRRIFPPRGAGRTCWR